MKLNTLAAMLLAASAAHAAGPAPVWLEADSAAAIHSRLLSDFRYTYDEARRMIVDRYGVTPDMVDSFAARKYIEVKEIDGVKRVHRKSIGNLALLNPAMNGGWKHRGYNASPRRISYVDSVISYGRGTNPRGLARHVKYRFSIDVPYNEALKGDTLRVWMPMPFESPRQHNVNVVSTFPEEYVLADTARTMHNSISFTQPVAEGRTTHFECVVEYEPRGQYFHPDTIRKRIRPYNTGSEVYRRYTSVEPPHVIHAPELARAIVGDVTDPYLMSEKVYDYIIAHYPWAGAREYSTIECIPQYVIDENHGDCGQVALLYISLMRSLGVPARWESGWMIHPGEKNLHDWAEVYFEGVGWVPVDISFGRYTPSSDSDVVRFYSTGMDSHRLAANRGVCGRMDPPKKFVRSETVDFQLGEVESTRGNLFYPAWDQSLEIIENYPVKP